MKRSGLRRVSRRRGGATRAERARLDVLARTIVMLRAGASLVPTASGRLAWWGRCQWCGCERWLQWCHIHSRSAAPALKWDPDNAFAGCEACHLFKWHSDPSSAEEFIVGLLGEDRRELLRLRAKTVSKPDLALLRVWLEREVERMGGSLP